MVENFESIRGALMYVPPVGEGSNQPPPVQPSKSNNTDSKIKLTIDGLSKDLNRAEGLELVKKVSIISPPLSDSRYKVPIGIILKTKEETTSENGFPYPELNPVDKRSEVLNEILDRHGKISEDDESISEDFSSDENEFEFEEDEDSLENSDMIAQEVFEEKQHVGEEKQHVSENETTFQEITKVSEKVETQKTKESEVVQQQSEVVQQQSEVVQIEEKTVDHEREQLIRKVTETTASLVEMQFRSRGLDPVDPMMLNDIIEVRARELPEKPTKEGFINLTRDVVRDLYNGGYLTRNGQKISQEEFEQLLENAQNEAGKLYDTNILPFLYYPNQKSLDSEEEKKQQIAKEEPEKPSLKEMLYAKVKKFERKDENEHGKTGGIAVQIQIIINLLTGFIELIKITEKRRLENKEAKKDEERVLEYINAKVIKTEINHAQIKKDDLKANILSRELIRSYPAIKIM